MTIESHPTTLARAVAEACSRFGPRPALIDEARCLTYADLAREVAALRCRYEEIGVTSGDRVLVSVSNRSEYLVAMIATWSYGAIHVGVDFRSTGPELAAVAELTGAATLVFEPANSMDPLAPLATVADHHPGLKVIVLSDHLLPAEYVGWPLVQQDAPAAADLASTSNRPDDDDAAMIFITSGTTGTPKATVGFHGNLASRWSRLAQWLQFGPEDVHLAQLPLSHGFGLMMTVAALLTGGQLVLLSRFSGERALELISARGVTVLNGAPTHFRSILQRLDETRHDVRTLRLSVGTAATFSPELVNSIWERLNVEFMYMYGSSEGVGVATTDPVDILLGSVGRPALGSVKVVDRDRREVPIGTVGEVAFSRDVYPVTYWAAHTRSGTGAEPTWYYSGDLGRLDHEGRLFIFGRLKHLIDRGGLKIDPVEVETALLRCPDVFDAAVIGRPDPMLGETVCACVVPTVGSLPTLGDLRAHLERVLSPFKLPETLEVVDEIPRTPVGKVDLSRLRDMITRDPELLRP